MAEVAQETLDLLVSQIKSVEAQLASLRRQVEQLQQPSQVRSLADLYGIFPAMDISEEEIDSARYRFDWDEEVSPGAHPNRPAHGSHIHLHDAARCDPAAG